MSRPLAERLRAMPPGSLVPAAWVAEQLDGESVEAPQTAAAPVATEPATWRERVWTCPAETRLRVPEVAEALDRSESYVYRRTMPRAEGQRLPVRRDDGGEVWIAAGDLREWIKRQERRAS